VNEKEKKTLSKNVKVKLEKKKLYTRVGGSRISKTGGDNPLEGARERTQGF